MAKLKLIPEQKNLEQRAAKGSYKLSKEFRRAIEMSLEGYTGMLSPDNKTVDVPCLKESGFNPDLDIDYFLKGALYAQLVGKSVTFFYPDTISEVEVQRMINEVFYQSRSLIKTEPYPLFYKGKPLLNGCRVIVIKAPKH
ncbi:hypothetical protein KY348_00015 [Candidatus Woesearchaeota archaeon]|nr:hypothetical protein [Candidatus Woesearchaeota archaeon]